MGALFSSADLTSDTTGKSCADPVRVMIVDDSLTVRTVFSRMIAREGDMRIVATANTAESGLAELASARPDVILLDLEMPGMGGLEALPKILEAAPDTQVLVISSLTADGAEATVSALSLGAADTMLKPRPGGFDDEYKSTLLDKIRALKGVSEPGPSEMVRASGTRKGAGKPPKVVAIGASTGGIHALNLFLRQIPADFDLPILIGTSRKRFVAAIGGAVDNLTRDFATASTTAIARLAGGAIFRVHNVGANRAALAFADAMIARHTGDPS